MLQFKNLILISALGLSALVLASCGASSHIMKTTPTPSTSSNTTQPSSPGISPLPSIVPSPGKNMADYYANAFLKQRGTGAYSLTTPVAVTYNGQITWKISFSAPEGLASPNNLYCPAGVAAGTPISYNELTGGILYIEKNSPYDIIGNPITFRFKHLTGDCIKHSS